MMGPQKPSSSVGILMPTLTLQIMGHCSTLLVMLKTYVYHMEFAISGCAHGLQILI